jgi:hypothetical protein
MKEQAQEWNVTHRMGFILWLIEQIKGDTMFAAECFLQDIKKKTTGFPIYKSAIEHVWQALNVVAYGAGGDPEFFEFSEDEQDFIRATARVISYGLTDAPKQIAANASTPTTAA